MDTPDKKQLTASSLPEFEDSPVSKYISNLSPIETVKSVHTDFNLLPFASPSSLFPSPQINCLRESRFSIRRHQSPDLLKLLQSGKENSIEGVPPSCQLSDLRNGQLGDLAHESLAGEASSGPPDEQLNLAIELPKGLKYDCGSPHSKMVPFDEISTDATAGPLGSQSDKHKLKQIHHPREIEKELRRVCLNRKNQEAEGCEWVTLISDVAESLNFNSPASKDIIEGQQEKTVDQTISFISNVLQCPQDANKDVENIESVGTHCSDEKIEIRESASNSQEVINLERTHQGPAMLSSNSVAKLALGNPSSKVDGMGEKCVQTGCKQQNSIRRRCLVFEMAGAHRKKPVSGSLCSSSISEVRNSEKQLDKSKMRSNYPLSVSPGIGLHLNALASTSDSGKFVRTQTLASGMKLISIPGSMPSSNSLSTPSSMETELALCDSEDIEKAPQTCTDVGEELDCDNPKGKRHKSGHVGGENCKRCNCRRSRCLKLYCECFAAGLYCIEPCSCQDCFNKPIYEDTVLEIRRQIESRNPLAFAPKVIRSTDSATEFGEENNKTPASARHKRGCNCRKSSCLKKYCECFQGGVGCSISCRCEGCKNTFGQKYGADQTDFIEEDSEDCERNALDLNSHDEIIKGGEEEHPGPPLGHSSAIARLCTRQKLGTSDLFYRQPKFESHLQVIPEDETPVVLESNCEPTNAVKSTSPNSKRISPPHQEVRSSSSSNASRKLILRLTPAIPHATMRANDGKE